MANKKPRYPIREYLGKFESYVLVMRGRTTFKNYDRCLEQFFAVFPNKTGLEQFTSVDIADWKALKLKQGIAEITLGAYTGMLNGFWKWLIQYKELPLNNPVRAYKRKLQNGVLNRAVKYHASLDDLHRFLEHCPSNKEREQVLRVVLGGSCRLYSQTVWSKRAIAKAGLVGFSLSALKSTFGSRIAKEIVEAYCDQLRNSFPKEAELSGNTLTTVEGSTPNVWSTVSDYSNNYAPVVGVNEQQPSPEGQSLVGNS